MNYWISTQYEMIKNSFNQENPNSDKIKPQ